MDTDEYGTYVSVNFYDTNKDEDINVNQVLFEKILEDIASAFKVHVIIIQFVIPIFYYCALLFSIRWWSIAAGTIDRIVRYAYRRMW